MITLLKEYPTYRTYCTGHSLGGALVLPATLMAFDLATTPEIPKPEPVSCITSASPKVGNIDFRHAFQVLEKRGQLRCIRVANSRDVIPGLPTKACCCLDCCCGCCCLFPCSTGHTYRYWHVGATVTLYRGGSCVLYQRSSLKYWEQVHHELNKRDYIKRTLAFFRKRQRRSVADILRNHSCKEYVDRLDAVKDVLDSLYLNDLHFKQTRQSTTRFYLLSPSDIVGIEE